MNALYMNMNDAAGHVITDGTSRARVLAAAIAVALSAQATMPSSEVENPNGHYTQQIEPQMKNLLSAFNENMVFDLRAAQDQARQYWMLRYTAAHPLAKPIFSLKFGFFDSLMGVATYIDEEQHAFVNANKGAILHLASQATAVIIELKKQNG